VDGWEVPQSAVMKAVRYTEYGSPKLTDVERPSPKDGEVLIRVHAASVNALDWYFMRGKPYLMRMMTGLRKPKDTRLGVDVAGTVESMGMGVTQLKPGDEVFGVCRGAFAEYACASESRLVIKPANISFNQAAAVPIAGVTALMGLRKYGKIQPGQKVLINGAGGGVGTFAVQIASALGADVTAVTRTENLEMVGSIGASHVVDYTREDFTKSGQRYDVIFDLGANHRLSDLRRALTDRGTWLLVGAVTKGGWLRPLTQIVKGVALSPFASQKVLIVSGRATRESLTGISEFLESGKVVPVIDRVYPLSEVREAMRRVEEGRARGKVVITILDGAH
jgi:NADPH:quinone reductase-like Zn-dependent oxidoreductase